MTNEHYCFCDLAPFYALDVLSPQEKEWVEQQVAANPELAAELVTYGSAVGALAYSVPFPPMAMDLKERLFERLQLDWPEPPNQGEEPVAEASVQPFLAVRSQDLNWQPHTIPGVQVAIVHRDLVKQEVVGFLKADPGVRYPYHRHAAVEELFLLEGDLVVGDTVFSPGDYIRSLPGSEHAPYTVEGCRFFFRTSMDDDYPDVPSTQLSNCP